MVVKRGLWVLVSPLPFVSMIRPFHLTDETFSKPLFFSRLLLQVIFLRYTRPLSRGRNFIQSSGLPEPTRWFVDMFQNVLWKDEDKLDNKFFFFFVSNKIVKIGLRFNTVTTYRYVSLTPLWNCHISVSLQVEIFCCSFFFGYIDELSDFGFRWLILCYYQWHLPLHVYRDGLQYSVYMYMFLKKWKYVLFFLHWSYN